MRLLPFTMFTVALFAISIPRSGEASLATDVLVRGSGKTVYYHASDAKRYVFPDQKTYQSWFTDFSGVIQISDETLAGLPLGGVVTHRPGIRMVKIQTDPRVYTVSGGGVLRWVKTETLAEEIYGPNWNTIIDDVSDALFVNYRMGQPIESPDDFVAASTAAMYDVIGTDKGLPVTPSARKSDTTVKNRYEEWRKFALDHMNNLRAQHDKPPLVMSPLLNRIAFMHSKDMARNIRAMSHDGSRGENAGDRIYYGKVPDFDSDGFLSLPVPGGGGQGAENVGRRDTRLFGGSVEQAIVSQHKWFLDELPDEYNHRTTMLGTFYPFNEVGIGLYLDRDGVIWITENFVVKY